MTKVFSNFINFFYFYFFAELVTKPRLLLKLEFKTKRHEKIKKTYKHISIGFLAFDLFYPQNDML